MISITFIHDKTLALIDNDSRQLRYLPIMNHMLDDDHYALIEFEIMSYLYENTLNFAKRDLLHFEE